MSDVVNVSRRKFLQSTTLAGGGLVLAVLLPTAAEAKPKAKGAGPAPFVPNAFLRIAPDGKVTVIANHSEMGQGTYTSTAMMVAEELDADWKTIRVESAPADKAYAHTAYGMQMTGGSSSTWSEFERLRKAGATARAMLIAAAAAAWKLEPSALSTENGAVVHAGSKKRATYGQLAAQAAKLTPPKDAPLKDPKTYRFIGKPTKRVDTPEKVNGRAIFGLDVSLPGMLVAVVARPPVFGGTVKSFDAAAAQKVAGVKHVVQIDRGVAVVADGFWPAKLGRDALTVEWDLGPHAQLDSAKQGEEYVALGAKDGVVAKKEGDAAGALAKAAKKVEATYDVPYLAHATMEPMNCVADVRADACEVWLGSQFQTSDHATAVKLSGLKPEQVQLHTTLLGGGFGRRAVPDCHMVAEAVQVSRAIKTPVKVVWTREDDMRGGYYRPRAVHVVKAGLDDKGAPLAWDHKIVVQSFVIGSPFEAFIVKNGVDDTAVEGASDLAYAIPNLRVDWHNAKSGVPTLWWRSVGHTHTAFAVESMIDELAAAAGKDPFEFRRGLLEKHPRRKRALELAAEKAGWGTKLPEGRARGIAVHESFLSTIAQVAEVSLDKDGHPRVHRVVCAVDCGPVINPDTVAAQMESAVVFGLSAALYGEISFAGGRVMQRNFHDYPVLRMNEMPVVEVHIVPSTDKMGGIGEPGVPPVAPAVTNALFALTGERVRKLPLRHHTFKKGQEENR